jgi:hypothetical protein
MQGVEFMIKRAEYRKIKEAHLFEKIIQWASEEGDTLVVEIVERAFADDDAERWLTIHPTSSFTGLTLYYMDVVADEKELIGNERRLLTKRLSGYSKRLLG